MTNTVSNFEAALANLLDLWRQKAFEVCHHRGWSTRRDHRFMVHILECAEFTEALRGKPGDTVEEAGDLLFTALAMIPGSISMQDVVKTNFDKIQHLMKAPPYAGEEKDEVDWKDIFLRLVQDAADGDPMHLRESMFSPKQWEAISRELEER